MKPNPCFLVLSVRRCRKMNRRYSIAVARRRSSAHVLEGRNRISPGLASDDDLDIFELESEYVLASMREMTPDEADEFAARAVAAAETARREAAAALLEAEAAEAEADEATVEAAAAFLATLKERDPRGRSMMRRLGRSGSRVGQVNESGSRAGQVNQSGSRVGQVNQSGSRVGQVNEPPSN